MDPIKRHLLQGLALAPFLALGGAARALAEMTPEERSYAAHMELMSTPGLKMHGDETIAMILYTGFTALDLVGPQYLFASLMGARLDLVSTQDTLDPVMSDTGLAIAPTATLADQVANGGTRDIIFLPGGTTGTAGAMKNDALLGFLQSQAKAGATMTAVCTGTLILAKAGLLKNRKATSHWITRPLLERFGATPVEARVVADGPVLTGAGVTAGFDFGLALVARLRGDLYAKALQLQAEYDPEPPFNAGSPQGAGEFLAKTVRGMSATVLADFEALAP